LPPPPLLNVVPGIGNDVTIPDKSGIGTPFTIIYAGTSTINSLTSTRAVTLSFQTGALTIGNGGGTGVFIENGIFNVASGFVLTNNAGTLSLNGGTLSGSLAGSGTFRFINGTFDLNAGLSMTVANWLLTYQIGSGTVSTTNLNTDLTYGGNFTIDAPFGNAAILNLNSRVLTLSGTSGLGGNIVGPGTLRILGDATLNGGAYLGGALLQIAKTVTQTGTASQAGGYGLLGTVRVDAGASYTITAASNIDSLGVANQALVINNGSFAANGVSANASRLAVGFTNGAGATLSVAAGATLKLGFADFRGTTDSLYNGVITGAGRLWLSGNSTLNPATLTVGAILAGDTTTIARNLTYGGQFTLASFAALKLGNRTLALSGTSNFTGGFNSIEGGGTLRVIGSATFNGFSVGPTAGATLRNSGAITQTGSIFLNNGSTLLNDAGRTYTLAGGDIALNGGSLVTNNGTFLVTTTNTAFHATDGGSFTNAGTLDVGAGATLVLGRSGGSATLGGTVRGAGTLIIGNAALNSGVTTGRLTLGFGGTTVLGLDTTYAGAFAINPLATLALNGHTLTLTGSVAIEGNVQGSAGIDKLIIKSTLAELSGLQLLNWTAGTDILEIGGTNNADSILGTTYGDSIASGNGHDTLNGGAGNDTIDGGGGNDTYRFDTDFALGTDTLIDTAVTGTDTLDFSTTTTRNVVLNLSVVAPQVVNPGLTLSFAAGSRFEAINGGSLNDTLTGNLFNNTLRGLAGNDTLDGGAGNDTLDGGGGNDTCRFDTDFALGTDTLIDTFATGTDTLDFSATSTRNVALNLSVVAPQVVNAGLTLNLAPGSRFEGITGGALNDSLTGNLFANTLAGLAGNDALLGLEGNDTLIGAAGNDTLDGGGGDDTFSFDADGALGTDTLIDSAVTGIDTLDFSATSTRNVALNLSVVAPQVVNAGLTLNLTPGSRFENITGGALNDTLTGNLFNNTLRGLAGNDTLIGGAGNDTLDGGAGNDIYSFDADTQLGTDTLLEDPGAAGGIDTLAFNTTSSRGVVLDLQLATLQTVNANLKLQINGGDRFENINGSAQNDILRGNALNNTLLGLGGSDRLEGRAGNDTLSGGAGNDTLIGGANADTFRFDTPLNATTNRDTITDFSVPQGDRIELENAIFTALPLTGTLAPAAFRIGATATTAAHRILYNSPTGLLSYDSDGNGGNTAIAFATLTPGLALTNASFIVT
jgi:Ca2+-binding RTX toxin-like protein